MKAMIAAYDNNRVLGKDGKIPWQGKMRRDAHYFRDMTLRHPVIMGRKTYEAMGRTLPNRPNIIVTSSDLDVNDAKVVRSLDQAYAAAAQHDDLVFVIGGGQIYQAALDDVDVVYATEVDADTNGDSFFPELDPAVWRETHRESHRADEQNVYDYAFVTYERV